MILSEKLQDELQKISNEIDKIMLNKSLTGVQIENFLKLFEKRRYNILKEIKMYNKNEINIIFAYPSNAPLCLILKILMFVISIIKILL